MTVIGRQVRLRIPAELLSELMQALESASDKLGIERPREASVPAETLRDLVAAVRAAGGAESVVHMAEEALSATRSTPAGNVVEIDSQALRGLIDEVARAGSKLIAERTVVAESGAQSPPIPEELVRFLRQAIVAAEGMIESLAREARETLRPLPQSRQVDISVDLLARIARAVQESGEQSRLIREATRLALIAPAGRQTRVDLSLLREFISEIERAGAQLMSKTHSGKSTVRAPASLYYGAVAAIVAAAESVAPSDAPSVPVAQEAVQTEAPRVSTEMVKSTTAAMALIAEVATATHPAVQSPIPSDTARAIQNLADVVKSAASANEPIRTAAESISAALESIAKNRPALARQIAESARILLQSLPQEESIEALQRLAAWSQRWAQSSTAQSPPASVHLSLELPPMPPARIQALIHQLRSAGVGAIANRGGYEAFMTLRDSRARPSQTAGINPRSGTPTAPGATAPTEGVESAIRNLFGEVGRLLRVASTPARMDASGLEAYMRVLAQSNPAFVEQAATAMNAAIPREARAMREYLARSGVLFAQLLALARTGTAARGPATPMRQMSFLLQMLMEADPRQTGRIQGLISELRRLGARVETRPSESRPGFTELLILIGAPNDPRTRRFRLDLRMDSRLPREGSSDRAGETGRAETRDAVSGPADRSLDFDGDSPGKRQERHRQDAPDRRDDGLRDSGARELRGTKLYEYNPVAAHMEAPIDGRFDNTPRRHNDNPATDLLLLTYEPEKTREWEMRHGDSTALL